MKKIMLLIIILGCSSSREERLLEESKKVHEDVLNIGVKISEKISKIDDYADDLDEPKKSTMKDSVKVLLADWGAWQASIVEVPGHDHDHHDHDHPDHNHDHGPAQELTPAMVLEIQQDLQKRALNLDVRAQNILETLSTDGK